MTRQITWGNATFTFERPVFLSGFRCGRNCYFYEMDGERNLSDEELLTVIALKDTEGRYHIDFDLTLLDHPQDGMEELIGTLIGYLSGPILSESQEERTERLPGVLEVVQES